MTQTPAPVQRLPLTPAQTVGPFFSEALTWPDGPFVVAEGTPGGFWLRGTVLDGAGKPVPDALVESWQADPAGRFDHPNDPRGAVPGFRGFGRSPTGPDGRWAIHTLRPGRLAGSVAPGQAPHLDLSVFARGLLDRVVTRVYLPDEPTNVDDPVLAAVPRERRHTLIAVPTEDGLRFDIHLQGEHETVFFDV